MLAGIERQRRGVFDGGRPLKADILRRRMLEAGLRPRGFGAHQIAQLVDADLLRHVVQHEHPERSAERSHACIVRRTDPKPRVATYRPLCSPDKSCRHSAIVPIAPSSEGWKWKERSREPS